MGEGEWRGREGVLHTLTALIRRHVPVVKKGEGEVYPDSFSFGEHVIPVVSPKLLSVDEGVLGALRDEQVMVRNAAVGMVKAGVKRLRGLGEVRNFDQPKIELFFLHHTSRYGAHTHGIARSQIEEVLSKLKRGLRECAGSASGMDGILAAINSVVVYPVPGSISKGLREELVEEVAPMLKEEASTVRQGGATFLGVMGWRERMVEKVGRKLLGMMGAQTGEKADVPPPPPLMEGFSPSLNRMKNDEGKNKADWFLTEGVLMTFEVMFRGLLNAIIGRMAEVGNDDNDDGGNIKEALAGKVVEDMVVKVGGLLTRTLSSQTFEIRRMTLMLIPVLSRALCWVDFGLIPRTFRAGEGRDMALKAAYLHVRHVQEGLRGKPQVGPQAFGASHEGIADNDEARYAGENIEKACEAGRREAEDMVERTVRIGRDRNYEDDTEDKGKRSSVEVEILRACVVGEGGGGGLEKMVKGACKERDGELYQRLFPKGEEVEPGCEMQELGSLLPYLTTYVPLSGSVKVWVSVLLFSILSEESQRDASLGVLKTIVDGDGAKFSIEALCEGLEGGNIKYPKGVLDCMAHLSPKCEEAPTAILLKTLEGLWGEKEQGGRDVYKGISVDVGGGEGEGGEGTKVRIEKG
jgi:hypothetical protein